jgi:two-component system sensor histidine kinase UhpB
MTLAKLFEFDSSHFYAVLLVIVTAIFNLGISIYTVFFLQRSKTNSTFSLFVFFTSLWQFTESFKRLSCTSEIAIEWQRVSEAMLILLISFGIIFILNISKWNKKIPNNLEFPLVFTPVVLLLFLIIVRVDRFNVDESVYWGWIVNPEPTFITLLIYSSFAIGGLTILVLLWLLFILENKNNRRFSLLLALGFTVPIIGGIVFEFILPIVFEKEDIPITASLVTCFSVAALLTIRKNEILDFSPKHHWEQIIQTMSEGIAIVNNNGEMMYVNETFCQMTEYSNSEIIGKIGNELFFDSSEQKDNMEKISKERIEKLTSKYEIQIKTKTGKIKWLLITGSPYKDKNNKVIGSIGIHTDITDRKNAEVDLMDANLQLHDLSTHLQIIREEERELISKEIHEYIGQHLVFIKLMSEQIKENTPDLEKRDKQFKDLFSSINEALTSVDIICKELRPLMLETLGLFSSLEWLASNFTIKTGIECVIKIECAEPDFRSDLAPITIFRIFQEAINNTLIHADATRINVEVKIEKKIFLFIIKDNGKGFDETNYKTEKKYGITGMKERANTLNGNLIIISKINQGTLIHLEIPIK